MGSPRIVLVGHSAILEGQRWTAEHRLSIGCMQSLEIQLDSNSVSRRHAEIALLENGWIVRDMGSSNGTFLNGVRVGRTGQNLHLGDILECGELALRVAVLEEAAPERIQIPTGNFVTVQAAAKRCGELAIRAVAQARGQRRSLSKTLAVRAFRQGESLLFNDGTFDAELQAAASVPQGTMTSIICAVLRSPDKTLGVLHVNNGGETIFTQPCQVQGHRFGNLLLDLSRRFSHSHTAR